MKDVLEITAASLAIIASGFEFVRLIKVTPEAGSTPENARPQPREQLLLRLILGLGALCLGLGAAAFLFARGEVELVSSVEGDGQYESLPDSSTFPEGSIYFSLLAIVAGLVSLWLTSLVRKTNEGLVFCLLLIGLGILTIMFTSSLPGEAFAS